MVAEETLKKEIAKINDTINEFNDKVKKNNYTDEEKNSIDLIISEWPFRF